MIVFPAHNVLLQELIQLDLACGWSFGVHWSPSGKSLAYVGEVLVLLLSLLCKWLEEELIQGITMVVTIKQLTGCII